MENMPCLPSSTSFDCRWRRCSSVQLPLDGPSWKHSDPQTMKWCEGLSSQWVEVAYRGHYCWKKSVLLIAQSQSAISIVTPTINDSNHTQVSTHRKARTPGCPTLQSPGRLYVAAHKISERSSSPRDLWPALKLYSVEDQRTNAKKVPGSVSTSKAVFPAVTIYSPVRPLPSCPFSPLPNE